MRPRRLAQEAADMIGARAPFDDVGLRLFDDVIGAGYGLPSQEGRAPFGFISPTPGPWRRPSAISSARSDPDRRSCRNRLRLAWS